MERRKEIREEREKREEKKKAELLRLNYIVLLLLILEFVQEWSNIYPMGFSQCIFLCSTRMQIDRFPGNRYKCVDVLYVETRSRYQSKVFRGICEELRGQTVLAFHPRSGEPYTEKYIEPTINNPEIIFWLIALINELLPESSLPPMHYSTEEVGGGKNKKISWRTVTVGFWQNRHLHGDLVSRWKLGREYKGRERRMAQDVRTKRGVHRSIQTLL